MGINYLYNNQIVTLLYTLLLLLLSNILFTFTNIKYYIVNLIFYITIFVFLVIRPTIDLIREGKLDLYQTDAYKMAFVLLIVAVLGLMIGSFLVPKRIENENKPKSVSNELLNKNIRKVSLFIFSISYPMYLIRLVERLVYRMNHSYYDYYSNFKSALPYITYTISSFMIYAMCIFLATKPGKKESTFVLSLFVLANCINLLIGVRNPFVLSIIFAFLYYFLRNQEEKGLWLGLKEKFVLYLGTPLMMIVMGIINYTRDNLSVRQMTFVDIILDFLYKQGVSFGVLTRGYLYSSNLPVRDFSSFTFNPLIEYFSFSNIGLIFRVTPYTTNSNSIELALHSNRYAHNLSYIVMGGDYLQGHGLGSSYIMEIYTDFGVLGLFLFSLVLGVLFIFMVKTAYKASVLKFSMTLIVFVNLFFMPRSSFFESFLNLFTVQFWGSVLIIYMGARLITKKISNISVHERRK